jgi:L-threonine-O-3-phosphate decarboxylase
LAQCAPKDLLDFSASINPLGPPESVQQALQGAIAHVHTYPDPTYSHLTAALAHHHQLDPTWILPGNGAAELLTWAARDLAQCDRTLLPVPAFADYGRALRSVGVAPVRVPLDVATLGRSPSPPPNPDGRTEDRRAAAPQCLPVPAVNPGDGILINSPHNPTGFLFDRVALRELCDRARLVVIDEAFMDFLPTPPTQNLPTLTQAESLIAAVADCPNLVILRSLTKFYSIPGVRLGYAIAHPDRLRRWQQWRDPWTVNTFAVAAGIAAVGDRPFQQRTWNWLPPARSQLIDNLRTLPGLDPLPGVANFLLVATTTPASHLQRELLQHDQILIRDCLSFPELGDPWFRIAVRTAADNTRLVQALHPILTSGQP